VAALRDGFLDVFSAAPRGLQPVGADAEGLRVALHALSDGRPEVRRTAAEILGQLERAEAAEPLLRALKDAEPEVRAEAVRALASLKRGDCREAIAACLSDPAAIVRRAAVDACAALTPDATDVVRPLASDPDPRTRARAAVALAKGADPQEAMRAISALLKDPVPTARAAGLEACRETGLGGANRILEFLDDDSAAVRQESVRALAPREPGAELDHRLADCLDDADPRVRDEAAEAMRRREGGRREALNVLRSGSSSRAQQAALKALRGAGEARDAILEWAVGRIEQARQMRRWQAGLTSQAVSGGPLEILFLRDRLQSLREERETEVLQALEVLGSGDALRLAAKGMRAEDRTLQAQAVEALETLGDPRLARAFTRLLESGIEGKDRLDPARTLEELSAENDPWLRGVALRLRIQRARADLREWERTLQGDGDPVLLLASEGISQGRPSGGGEGEAMSETLRTLGTMERVLVLQRVAIFAKLKPEDLQEIAVVAHERVFQQGDALCTEGEEGDELFILVEGKARVIKKANGEMKTLRMIEPVEQVGELSILRRQPRSASVIAEGGPARTLVITAQAFASILRDRHEVALATLSALAERLSSVV
jgi:HEAT repeat protein